MKYQIWLHCLFTGCFCLPLGFIPPTPVLATHQPDHVVKSISTYDQYMQVGYAKIADREYRQALIYFQQALAARPGDRQAAEAIRNIEAYIQPGGNVIIFPEGRPSRTTVGGTRPGDQGTTNEEEKCFPDEQFPVSLIPANEQDGKQRTTSEHPQFWFYIPETTTAIKGLEFLLRDDQIPQNSYRKTFEGGTKPGIVSIKIPTSEAPLTADRVYTWKLSIICDSSSPSDLYLKGKIDVVKDPNLSSQVQQTTEPLDQAMLYATAGLWENFVSILADLHLQRPNDPQINQYWLELLTSVGLAKAPSESP